MVWYIKNGPMCGHVLMSRTSKYVPVLGKEEFINVIKLKILS